MSNTEGFYGESEVKERSGVGRATHTPRTIDTQPAHIGETDEAVTKLGW
jgi:hypothetical protein